LYYYYTYTPPYFYLLPDFLAEFFLALLLMNLLNNLLKTGVKIVHLGR